jgi:peptidyl-dipeptidase Dcp
MKNFSLMVATGIMLLFTVSCGDEKKNEPVNDNPFFAAYNSPFDLPPFEKIKLEHILPAIKEGMKRQNEIIDSIVNNPAEPDFANTIETYEFSGMMLDNVKSVYENLLSANTSDSLQQIAKDAAPLLSQHNDNMKMNDKLFKRIQSVYLKKEQIGLNDEQKMLLELAYRKFVRGGALLSDGDKEKLKKINEELSVLALKFGDNVLAETNSFQMVIDKKEDLAGLPQGLIDAAAIAAKDKGMEGKWLFTLHNPSVMPFLQYSSSYELRKKMQQAYVNRGNNNNEFDNKEIIVRISALRVEKSRLLGFTDYASFVLDENMAKNPQKVYELLDNVWKYALPVAKKDAETYAAMMKKDGIKEPFDASCWRYYAEKVRKEKYDMDEEMLKPYFSLEKVRKGVFDVTTKLFGLTYRPLPDAPKYHPDAEVYEVLNENNEHVAILYLDFFPRESKRGGAWMSNFREQYYQNGKRISPVVTINCNFTKPTGDTPALLTFDEVETFFHEFGHGLHSMLSDCRYISTSGTNVPRDFVELPSQIMENWASEPEVLRTYALHYQTGEVIPDALIKKMEESGHFDKGFATIEYLAASYLDMFWNTLTTDTIKDVLAAEKHVAEKYGLIPEIVFRYRSTYFQHIFSGGYASGYYSYMWSEVLDADAFDAFKEKGLFDKETANSLRDDIFSRGHTYPADVMFRNFRGRDPDVTPALRRRGLVK